MKRVVIFVFLFQLLILSCKGKDVDMKPVNNDGWKKVAAFISEGRPKSALEEVEKIYKEAKKNNNRAEILKCFIHRLKLIGDVEESANVKTIASINEELKNAQFPEKNILHSMVAEIYWQFYQNNRYYIGQRSTTVNFDNNDINTWDTKKIVDECINNYTLSLNDSEKLKNIDLKEYEPILNYENSSAPIGRERRPTLFDFLGHRAFDYFANQEADVVRVAETFIIDNPKYFSDTKDFINLKIETKDSFAYKYYAMNILKDLIKLNLNNPIPLIDIELKRIDFIYNNFVGGDKDSLYLEALKRLEKKEPNLPITGEVTHRLANYYFTQGSKYNPAMGDSNKWDMKTAYDICSNVVKKYPSSIGAINCQALQSNIVTKTLNITIEEVNFASKPFKALVNYKNFNNIYFKVYPIKKEDIDKIRSEYNNYYTFNKIYKDYNAIMIDYFKSKKAISEFNYNLPDDKDYQGHSAEIKIESLNLGNYVILASDKSDFIYDGGCVAFSFTTISNISMISRKKQNNDYEFYLLSRDLGVPLKDAKVEVYEQKYNNLLSQYQYNKISSIKTDEAGYFEIKSSNNDYRTLFIEVSKGDDKFEFINNSNNKNEDKFISIYQPYNYIQPVTKKGKVFLFTDRAIYRPGQNVYFKGIAIETDDKNNNKILENTNVNLIFYDVNWQKVNELNLTTNKFGSVSGMFVAPKSGLTGQMQIYANLSYYGQCGSTAFSVEEYKRPKFEVTFQPVKGSYRLNDIVKLTGNAKAYSGANVDNANVKFRVTRNARFPYWFYYYYGYYPQSAATEIINGELKTNENGEFTIEFKAIPDMNLPKESKPTFTYQIAVDVTDLNGETRSGTNYLNIGYNALNIAVDIWDNVDKDKKSEFDIYSTNFAGEYEDSEGNVKIYKLKNPDKFFRSRLWAKPDKFVFSSEDAKKYFPDELYDDENNFYKWAKDKEVYSQKYNTKQNKKLILNDLKNYEDGKYYLEIATKDKFGSEVKEVYYFTLYSTKSKLTPIPVSYVFNESKARIEPGETLKVEVAALSSNVIFEIERDGKIIEKRSLKLSNTLNKGLLEKQTIEVPIKEEYRGNIGLHYVFVNDGRLYSESKTITVPFTNKELDVTFETFRDKLMPGEDEEWKIKITGKNKERFVAEMVMTLYDASLEAFRGHNFYFNIYNSYYASLGWSSLRGFNTVGFQNYAPNWNETSYGASVNYDYLNWFGYNFYDFERERLYAKTEKSRSMKKSKKMMDFASDSKDGDGFAEGAMDEEVMEKEQSGKSDSPVTTKTVEKTDSDVRDETKSETSKGDVQIRTNFNETAFFYPELKTNSEGEIIVKFKIPESLTRWRLLGLAHTQNLEYGFTMKELVTQKDLMVVPNPPRFFREGDSIVFTSKITNVSENDLNGEATLELFDSTNMKPINIFDGDTGIKQFSTKKGQSDLIKWKLKIPPKINAITYRLIAKSNKFSDGEEAPIPVLTNRMLVTETLPLPIRSNQTKTYTLDKLINNNSTTLVNHKLTLEFTSNPAWYAILALPYIMEYPYECAEQLFNRYYSNTLATYVINSSPKIKQVFDMWKNLQSDAFLSNLEKNQELKSMIIEETPWLLDAKDESTRKRRIGILFEVNKMNDEMERALKKLSEMQSGNGGFAWFKGMKENLYITQYIVTGIGHLSQLKVIDLNKNTKLKDMVTKAVSYIDNQMKTDYDWLLKAKIKDKLDISKNQIGYYHINYFYARSFFTDIPVNTFNEEAFNYFKWQIKTYWNDYLYNKYFLGLIALGLNRYKEEIPKKFHGVFNSHKMKDYGSNNIPQKIITSLKENALYSEEMGMYWKPDWGYYWYQLPIETYAMMIEVFSEVANDNESVDGLKTYLLKQKQTQDWGTTKGTADAIYALLLKGDNWLASESLVEITLGSQKIEPPKDIEAGTGYFKINFNEDKITKDMGKVTLVKKDKGVSWGALYWQYFENLDKITKAETPLKLDKKLFIENNTPSGKVIIPIDKQKIKIGDKIIVRIELRVDRDMEYVHMKDQRGSSLEPVNVLSQYKYQDGLGYYESTRDSATNFFFDYLPKGTYVFEYPLFVTHSGDFSNGITTIQCMYAPEFSSHSEGIRFKVE